MVYISLCVGQMESYKNTKRTQINVYKIIILSVYRPSNDIKN